MNTNPEPTLQRPPGKLAELEILRAEVFHDIESYDKRLETALLVYRSQRAWQIMLMIRKAYALLFRQGWHGRREFVKWMLQDIPRGKADLTAYDLTFPDIWDFLPEDLYHELAGAGQNPCASNSGIKLAALSDNPNHKYDIVILPIFDFEFRFQRPQQLAVQFARAGHRVFWISPSRMLSEPSKDSFKLVDLKRNLWEVQLRAPRLNLYSGPLPAETIHQLRSAIHCLWKEAAISECCLYLQFPYWRRLAVQLRTDWGAKIVYDCMDDWQNWPTEPLIGQGNLEDERALVKECDLLIVTAEELKNRFGSQAQSVILVPNGSDFEFFNAPARAKVLDGIPSPIIGYYGAVANWFDIDAVAALAEQRPEYSIVIIGQIHKCDVSRLKACSNVHLLGEKPYREIPAYLSKFDVCLIPFVKNELTNAVDPVKLYEYLSQGKPVVANAMEPLVPHKDLIYLARDSSEFVAAVDRAIADDNDILRGRRLAFASRNTWRARYEHIDPSIKTRFPLISVVLVTYNSEEFIQAFWASFERNTSYPNVEAIFVDNNSTDGTRDVIRRVTAGEDRVICEFLNKNIGFAGGNNAGVRASSGEYIVLLNPDTIVSRGWLERLLRPLRDDSTIGMVAPVSNFSGNETRINTSYQNGVELQLFAESRAREHCGEVADVSVIPLFCGCTPRRVWDRVGGLDERFQVGMFEDDDFSLRIRQAGYRTVMAEDCFIHHFGNGSFAKLPSADALNIFDRNKRLFEEKWGRKWAPHKTRPGVRPPGPEDRMQVSVFMPE